MNPIKKWLRKREIDNYQAIQESLNEYLDEIDYFEELEGMYEYLLDE